jgi:hypothetical protein
MFVSASVAVSGSIVVAKFGAIVVIKVAVIVVAGYGSFSIGEAI